MTDAPEILTALTTAFTADGKLDRGACRALMEYVEPHVQGVFAIGSTAEFLALEPSERRDLLEDAVDVLGTERVIAHVGAASVHQVVRHLRDAEALGLTRFGAITPFYLAAGPDSVVRHFSALRAATAGELYAYVYPDLTRTEVSPETMRALAEVGVDGAKISGAASKQIAEHIAALEGRSVWTGNGGGLPEAWAAGGRGTIAAVSGVAPAAYAALRTALAGTDSRAAEVAQEPVAELAAALGPSITRLKHGLDLLGLPGGITRMTIDLPSPEVQQQIRTALDHAGLLGAAA